MVSLRSQAAKAPEPIEPPVPSRIGWAGFGLMIAWILVWTALLWLAGTGWTTGIDPWIELPDPWAISIAMLIGLGLGIGGAVLWNEWFLHRAMARRRARAHAEAWCLWCGYDLSGLIGAARADDLRACPKCGHQAPTPDAIPGDEAEPTGGPRDRASRADLADLEDRANRPAPKDRSAPSPEAEP